MKKLRIIIINLISFLCINNTFATRQIIDKVIAVVDNSIILKSDVNNMLNIIKNSAKKVNQQLPGDVILRHQILDRLIMDNILLQLAKNINITVSDEQLDQVISNIATQNHITLDQLYKNLSYNGISYDDYRTQIRKEILITEAVNTEVSRRIIILPIEIDLLAKQIATQIDNSIEFNLSHILIPIPKSYTGEQVSKAESLAYYLINQSKNSVDFSKLAITYSSDANALKGGQMGWNKIEELPVFFAAHLHDTHKGSIVGPIRSGIGFHIIKVNDIRSGYQKVPITEVHARHIFLRTSVIMTDPQAYAKLEDLAQQIKRGSISFGIAAKQLSEDPSSANQGGDLGWNSIDIFDPVCRNTLLHLKKTEISAPIKSAYGWHLIQLIDTRQVNCTDSEKKNYAYRLLFNRKFNEEIQTWMQEQRTSTYVKVLDNK